MKKRVAQSNHVVKRNVMRHAVPVLVWLVTVGVVIWLFLQRAQRFQVVGIAQSQVRQVATSSTGRIRDITVDLFEPVTAGQTVAVIDTLLDNEQTIEVELRTQLAAAAAEAVHLAALLVPTQEQWQVDSAGLKMDRADSQRRFAVDVESVRLRILELQALIASDRVTLNDLGMEVKILEDLLEKGAIASYELDKAKVQYDSLAGKVGENAQLLQQARVDLQEAEARRAEFAEQPLLEPSVDGVLEAIRRQIEVQEELVSGLSAQLKALEARRSVELKSPIDGVVVPVHGRANEAFLGRPGEHVMRRPGEVVTAGEPILVVAQQEPTEIVAYVPETQIGLLKDAMPVELVKNREPPQIARSRVVSVGPTIELMPQRLWLNPNVPQWGRPILIEVPSGLSIVPGEVVGIRGL